MMDTRKELREGSRDRRIPDDPVTCFFVFLSLFVFVSLYSAPLAGGRGEWGIEP
jgi:hypothetical protein